MVRVKRRLTSLYPFAMLLTFLGGYMEIVSLKGFGLFCAMQTGNTITLFLSLLNENWSTALWQLIVLLSFFAGLLIGAFIRKKFPAKPLPFHSFALLLAALLLLVSFGLSFLGDSAILAIRILLALYGSFQVLAFERFDEERYVSTMMTVVMKNIAVHLVEGILEKDKKKLLVSLEFFSLLCTFVLGVCLGFLLYRLLPSLKDGYLLLAAGIFAFLLFPLSFVEKQVKEPVQPEEKAA